MSIYKGSHRIFNRWWLVYYTEEPHATRKSKNQMNRQEHLDSDIEELMSTSETGANSQKGDSDEESSATLETVE